MVLISQDSTLASVVQEVVARTPGIRLERVQDHDEAYDRVASQGAALVLSHLTPAGPVAGLTRLLSTLEAGGRGIPVLVLSDEYHAQQALALHRLGVADYLSRPLDLGRLGYLIDILTLARRCGAARPESVAPITQPQMAVIPGDESFLLAGVRMGEMIEQIRRIAPQDTTILLGGETGSGKTRLAGVIHRLSPRRDKPLLTVNCGALAANLIESEMFGHVKGAFTGADTNRIGKFTEVGRGTLFLDEIDSLPPVLQAKLLRAVEDRVFEPVGSNKTQPLQARLISASNRPLDQEVASGRFRADLYYRLNVVAFNLPPLRERVEGIPQLASAFLAREHPRAAQRHRASRGAIRRTDYPDRGPARRVPRSRPGHHPEARAISNPVDTGRVQGRSRTGPDHRRAGAERQQPPPRRGGAGHQPHDPLQEAAQARFHGGRDWVVASGQWSVVGCVKSAKTHRGVVSRLATGRGSVLAEQR